MDDHIMMTRIDDVEIKIKSGDMVRYEGELYLVLTYQKESGNGWILHPCGNNPNTDDIIIDSIEGKVELI